MREIVRVVLVLLLAAGSISLAGCALPAAQAPALYDLGPTRPISGLPALPAISVAEVGGPAWLDRPLMYYRLNYQNDQQLRPYAHNRWTTPPAQLILQRLKERIALANGTVLPASDGAANLPLLRLEADDFTQSFGAPGQSTGRVALRASLLKGRVLIAQKTFVGQAPAPSADASGGAHALAAASDAAIADLMHWLASLPLK